MSSTTSAAAAAAAMDRIVLPESYYTCDTSHLIQMIADMLCTLMSHNDQIPVTHTNLTRFHSRAAPGITIADYLRRIIKYASVERACLLAILLYIDRVCERHRSFTISSLTVHRFIIAAVTVSAKAICDSYCTNAHYAKVGGISTQELNTLELEFLFLIDWQVASPAAVLQQYYANLVRQYPAYTRSLTPAAAPPPGTTPDTSAKDPEKWKPLAVMGSLALIPGTYYGVYFALALAGVPGWDLAAIPEL
uniref:Pho cyclin 80 n=1 Tax=Blastocladiella emersonii TaxID=4808 RepID=A0A238HJI0_BLAEM|nr:Pho cyclin 80 [Blastocladiella emersonii]